MSDDSPARVAFEAWWARCGYTPPDDTDDRDTWNAYHLRYGLAWMAFCAGHRSGSTCAPSVSPETAGSGDE